MKTNVYASFWMSLLLAGGAGAQMSGVSHPDQTPIVSSETGAQPAVAKPSAQLPLRASSFQQSQALAGVPDPDGSIVEAVRPAPIDRVEPAARVEPAVRVDQVDRGDRAERSVRVDDASLQPNPDARIVTRVEGPADELPAGTLVKAVLKQDLSTRDTQVGTLFTAEVAEPVVRDGRVLLPAGALLTGKVTAVRSGKRISGGAALHLEPASVALPDGTRYKLNAQVIDTSLFRETRVDSEGTITPRIHPKQTVAVLALTTGAGVAAGAVFGGVPGALVGGGVGAGITTAMLLKEDRQEALPAGTRLVFSLTRPLAVSPGY